MYFRATLLGNTWFVVYLKDINSYIAAKKSSQDKNFPNTEKTDDLRLSFIKLYYRKKIEILNSTITVMTCIMRNSTKSYIENVKQFFISQTNSFRVIR